MEISGGDYHVLVREDVGVVGNGVDLVLDDAAYVADIVLYGAVNLRYAAERVRILHMLLGPADEFASFEQVHEDPGGLHLALMRAEFVRQRQEGFDAAVVGFERNGSDDVGPPAEALRLDEAVHRMGAHELGPVEKGQPLFALQGDGLPAEFFPYFGGRTHRSLVQHFAQADEGQAHVGEGSEVAGGAQGSLGIDYRQHVFVEHVHEPLYSGQLGSGMAV